MELNKLSIDQQLMRAEGGMLKPLVGNTIAVVDLFRDTDPESGLDVVIAAYVLEEPEFVVETVLFVGANHWRPVVRFQLPGVKEEGGWDTSHAEKLKKALISAIACSDA